MLKKLTCWSPPLQMFSDRMDYSLTTRCAREQKAQRQEVQIPRVQPENAENRDPLEDETSVEGKDQRTDLDKR